MLTQERALEIEMKGRANPIGWGGYFHFDMSEEMTPVEDTYVKEVWDCLPGSTCYHDAVMLILHRRMKWRDRLYSINSDGKVDVQYDADFLGGLNEKV